MAAFASPSGSPSGFNEVGSPDPLSGASGMIHGLLVAADAWDNAGTQLGSIAAQLGRDLELIASHWTGSAAAAASADLAKTERAASRGADTFHGYASDLRNVAAYVKKVRHIKEELRNLWKLILVEIFVALASLVLGFVGSELFSAALPALADLVSGLGSIVDATDLVDVAPSVTEASDIVEEIPGVTSDTFGEQGVAPLSVEGEAPVEPEVVPSELGGSGSLARPGTGGEEVPSGPRPAEPEEPAREPSSAWRRYLQNKFSLRALRQVPQLMVANGFGNSGSMVFSQTVTSAIERDMGYRSSVFSSATEYFAVGSFVGGAFSAAFAHFVSDPLGNFAFRELSNLKWLRGVGGEELPVVDFFKPPESERPLVLSESVPVKVEGGEMTDTVSGTSWSVGGGVVEVLKSGLDGGVDMGTTDLVASGMHGGRGGHQLGRDTGEGAGEAGATTAVGILTRGRLRGREEPSTNLPSPNGSLDVPELRLAPDQLSRELHHLPLEAQERPLALSRAPGRLDTQSGTTHLPSSVPGRTSSDHRTEGSQDAARTPAEPPVRKPHQEAPVAPETTLQRWAAHAGPKKAERDATLRQAREQLRELVVWERAHRSLQVERIVHEALANHPERPGSSATLTRFEEHLGQIRSAEGENRSRVKELERHYLELWRKAGNAEYERGHGFGESTLRLSPREIGKFERLRAHYVKAYEVMGKISLERERWRLWGESHKPVTWRNSTALGRPRSSHSGSESSSSTGVESRHERGTLEWAREEGRMRLGEIASRFGGERGGVAPSLTKEALWNRDKGQPEPASFRRVESSFDRRLSAIADGQRALFAKRLAHLYRERDDLIENRIKGGLLATKRARQCFGISSKDVAVDPASGRWVPVDSSVRSYLTFRAGANNVAKSISAADTGMVATDALFVTHGGFGWGDLGGRSIDDGIDMGWISFYYLPVGFLNTTLRSLLRRRYLVRPLVGKLLEWTGSPRDPAEWMKEHMLEERGGSVGSTAWLRANLLSYAKQPLWQGPEYMTNGIFEVVALHPQQIEELVETTTPSQDLPTPSFAPPAPPSSTLVPVRSGPAGGTAVPGSEEPGQPVPIPPPVPAGGRPGGSTVFPGSEEPGQPVPIPPPV